MRKVIFLFFLFFSFTSLADEPVQKTLVTCIPEVSYFRANSFVYYTDAGNKEIQKIEIDRSGKLRKKYNLIDEKDKKPFICDWNNKKIKFKNEYRFNNSGYAIGSKAKLWVGNLLLLDIEFDNENSSCTHTYYPKLIELKKETTSQMQYRLTLHSESGVSCSRTIPINKLKKLTTEDFKNDSHCQLFKYTPMKQLNNGEWKCQ